MSWYDIDGILHDIDVSVDAAQLTSFKTAAATAFASGYSAVLKTGLGYTGTAQSLSCGKYDIDDLLIGDNAVCSLGLAVGWKLTLYPGILYSGTPAVYSALTENLYLSTLSSYNSRASSIIVEPARVIIYADANYLGTSQVLDIGRYDIASLTIGNDKLSSFRVPSGWRVTLYQHSKFSGTSQTHTTDSAYVGSFNDVASSLVVEIDQVIVYSEANYAGTSQTLGVGSHNMAALTIGNDVISSLRVPAGWKVTLYQHSNFGGTAVSYLQDTTALGAYDNWTSSIVVESLSDTFVPVTDQDYTLTTSHSSMLASVSDASQQVGKYIVQATSNGGTNQHFRFVASDSGYYYLLARHSGQAMQVEGSSTTAGAPIVQYTLNQATSQQWFIQAYGAGYNLVARSSGLALGVSGGSLTAGANLAQWTKTGVTNQIWKIAQYEAATATVSTAADPISTPTVGGIAGTSSLGTASGTSQTTTAASLPTAVSSLNGMSIQILFVTFTFPFAFSGTLTIDPFTQAISYSGPATLSGAPFSGLSIDPFAISISNSDGWMVKFGLPKTTSIATLVETQVLSLIPTAVRPLVSALVLPFLRVYETSVIILAQNDGEDANYGSYLGGFNVFTTLMANQITPLDYLHSTFPVLGLDKRQVVLGVGASSSGDQKFFVGAELTLDVNLGTSMVVLNTIVINVTKETTSTALGAEVAFTLNLANEVLKLTGGLTVTTGTSNSVTVWGALTADDGAWEEPFGIKGLTINNFGIEVGVTTVFPYVVLGVNGEFHIGDGLLGGEIGILLDASDVSKCILDIYSEEGIDLPELVKAVTAGKFDVSSLLDVSLTELQLYIAPNGGTIAGKSYDSGLAIAGKLDLWDFHASVEGKLDSSTGGYFKGTMDAIKLATGGVTFLQITGASGTGSPTIDIAVSSSKVGGTIDGKVVILGIYSQATSLTLNSSGFSASLVSSSFGMTSNIALTMKEGLFAVSYSPTITASMSICGYTASLSVAGSVAVKITSSTFSQTVSFSFSAMGKSFRAGPFTVTVPFSSVSDILTVFYDKVKTVFSSHLTASIAEATKMAFDWVKSNITSSAANIAKVFQNAGAATANIATGLVAFCGTTAEDAVTYLSLSATEAASLLKNTFNKSIDDVGDYLADVGDYSDDTIEKALKGAGWTASQASNWAEDNLNPSNW